MAAQPIRRALLSVSDKAGLAEFGQFLASQGIEILSTGGTAQALGAAGVKVKEVSDFTGFPEMLGGRVKTLHPKVHGGILGLRDDTEHARAMAQHGLSPIDLVVVNLYPFEQTVAKGAPFAECIEQIDIGGPAMIRSAAKNHAFVTVVVDTADFAAVTREMRDNSGATSVELRRHLAAKAFARTAAYDSHIAAWFAGQGLHDGSSEPMPERITIVAERALLLRYGENPHQTGALYRTTDSRPGVAGARQVQGKELSYNNLGDADAAIELAAEFEEPAVAIIKHANPCGVAVGATIVEAYRKALACDPVSAFGGIVAANRRLDAKAAEEITKIFTEVVIAPDADREALALFAAKKNLRLLLIGRMPNPHAPGLNVRNLAGGLLVQTRDAAMVDPAALKVVTERAPTDAERRDLLFGMRVCKHVKSNAIVFARERATTGIGAGQMSRLDSVRIARHKAEDAAKAQGLTVPLTVGSVVASDAFFPFPDGLIAAAEAGATAVIQPGGSVRDDEIILAANERGLAMVFTGLRHFRH
ncbi:MAG: bifunctional phosphoribosylaminoimidazolecarboxamide formyltransferase/IMP cyclohydrolase [Alphaproteobacteria bacterium]|nr:bifunctional phosphoribosylaminoimidazolecarboxamide formyltransferase/IMP cyclohydrolase [Alphaproteobacteria bacterium]